jgi:organic hydroperoxide reductase OsmC/OhrA
VSATHDYATVLHWTGNRGSGTSTYRAYGRDCESSAAGRPPILASSDPVFRGDADRWNPELLLVAALSQCHLLSYLHCCATEGVVVTDYRDEASGTMAEDRRGAGSFVEVVLRPWVTVADPEMVELAGSLHGEAAKRCFIAASVSFPVRHQPEIVAQSDRRNQCP